MNKAGEPSILVIFADSVERFIFRKFPLIFSHFLPFTSMNLGRGRRRSEEMEGCWKIREDIIFLLLIIMEQDEQIRLIVLSSISCRRDLFYETGHKKSWLKLLALRNFFW